MTRIAIIPARGGSKRIPRKNLADCAGKPLLAWTVEAVLEADCFDRAIVTTDSSAIHDLALSLGAHVLCRGASLSGDDVPATRAVDHARSVVTHDLYGVFLPTFPVRSVPQIRSAVQAVASGRVDTARTVFSEGVVPGRGHTIRSVASFAVNRVVATFHGPESPPARVGSGTFEFLAWLTAEQAIDVDTPRDLVRAARVLSRSLAPA